MRNPSLGEQELALLNYIAEQGPLTVGEAAEGFGGPQNLTRSTVVTMMERLRKKGYLTRSKQEGVFRYASPRGREEIMNRLVQQFIEKTLAGSLVPFLAYFTQRDHLSEEERTALQQLAAKLKAPEKEAEP